MTDLERKIKAKIPSEETGITVKQTICDICCPSFHCGLDAYVKDGKVIKVEGTESHPTNKGLICPKGLSNKEYIYRKDRIKTPLKRVGKRGSGEFVEITWEQAYQEIAEKLLKIKREDGAESVGFYSGYSKWYRPYLHRFVYSFGTPNYMTESSNCMTSTFLNWKVTTGNDMSNPDITNAGVYLGWAFNPYYSRHLAALNVEKQKERGMKIIIVDPRITPATIRLADIHLQPRIGTDGALALSIANVLIRDGMTDNEYIKKYVYGYDEYAEYVKEFTPEKGEELTGVPAELIEKAAHMIGENGPVAINESAAPIAHHRNGFQAYRAIMALSAITGCFDKKGGQIPVQFTYNYLCAGFETKEHEFISQKFNKDMKPAVGAEKFPLWDTYIDEAQANDLARQIEQGTPYPIKAVVGFGFNYRISADSDRLKKALLNLDFLVSVDLFMTDTCKFCDIVLPACTSFERSEMKSYGGGYLYYTKPVIDKLYNSKSDVEIICELSKVLGLDDDLLNNGMDTCLEYMISDLPISLQEVKNADGLIKVPEVKPYIPGTMIENGLNTKSKKFELYSLGIADIPHLEPLPKYQTPVEYTDQYPYHLCSSARISNALHSRLHDIPNMKSLQPDPLADISKETAEKLDIQTGDLIEISSHIGKVVMKANVTAKAKENEVYIYHGYSNADANLLTDMENVDMYSGFASYRSTAVNIKKV